MTTDTKAVARYIPTSSHGGMVRVEDSGNGTYVSDADHERVVGELERLTYNVDTENEFLRTAVAASRAEVERLNLVIRGKSGEYGFAEAVASEGFENV